MSGESVGRGELRERWAQRVRGFLAQVDVATPSYQRELVDQFADEIAGDAAIAERAKPEGERYDICTCGEQRQDTVHDLNEAPEFEWHEFVPAERPAEGTEGTIRVTGPTLVPGASYSLVRDPEPDEATDVETEVDRTLYAAFHGGSWNDAVAALAKLVQRQVAQGHADLEREQMLRLERQ